MRNNASLKMIWDNFSPLKCFAKDVNKSMPASIAAAFKRETASMRFFEDTILLIILKTTKMKKLFGFKEKYLRC